MRSWIWAAVVVVAGLPGCGSAGEDTPQRDALALAVPPATKVELHLVFVHGVTQADSGRLVAHEQLVDLEKAVVEQVDGVPFRNDSQFQGQSRAGGKV